MESFLHYVQLAVFQFTPILFPLVLWGGWKLWQKNREVFGLAIAVILTKRGGFFMLRDQIWLFTTLPILTFSDFMCRTRNARSARTAFFARLCAGTFMNSLRRGTVYVRSSFAMVYAFSLVRRQFRFTTVCLPGWTLRPCP